MQTYQSALPAWSRSAPLDACDSLMVKHLQAVCGAILQYWDER